MVEYLCGALLGAVVGLVFCRLAASQIRNRTDDTSKRELLLKPVACVTWSAFSALLFVAVLWRIEDVPGRIEALIYISIALNIAAVDWLIKKIPNELLLALLVSRVAFIVVDIIVGKGETGVWNAIWPSLLGLGVGLLLFMIPSFLHIPIGAGDTKYCAAIGFCLGVYGFLQAMLIMAAAEFVFLVYLMITKKGNLKTAAAMGPFLSLGAVAAILLPLWNLISGQ